MQNEWFILWFPLVCSLNQGVLYFMRIKIQICMYWNIHFFFFIISPLMVQGIQDPKLASIESKLIHAVFILDSCGQNLSEVAYEFLHGLQTHCQFWDFSFTFCFSEARLPMDSSSWKKLLNDRSLEVAAVISQFKKKIQKRKSKN